MIADAGGTVTVRRILVAVDGSEHSLAAVEAAAELAARLQAELEALFVEDDDLLRLADLPFARVVSVALGQAERTDRQRMERQLRLRAARARRRLEEQAAALGVRARFRAVRGAVTAEVRAAAAEVDLVSLGRAGHGRLQRPAGGSTLQAALAAGRPVLVAQRLARPGRGVLAVYDRAEESVRALALAAELAGGRRGELHVLALASFAGEAEVLATRARAWLSARGIAHHLSFSWAVPEVAAPAAVRRVQPALLVAGAALAEELLAVADRPLLLVP